MTDDQWPETLVPTKQAIETALAEIARVWELELNALRWVPRKFDTKGCVEETDYIIDHLAATLNGLE